MTASQSILARMRGWLHYAMLDSVRQSEEEITIIGMIFFIGFLLYYYLLHDLYPQTYDSFALRIVGSILCLGLVFKKYWPVHLRPYFPIWWYITLLYSLPFLSTFMLLKNNYATMSLMVSMMSLFLLILLVDWLSNIVLYTLGVAIAWIAYVYTTPLIYPPINYLQYFSIFLFTIIAGTVLNYKSALLQQKKLEGMAQISGTIAHELRTPLLGIKSGAAGLTRYFPALFETYQIAKQNNLEIPRIRTAHFNSMLSVLERIEMETNYANTIIDMLLLNVRREFTSRHNNDTAYYNIKDCINEALDRYPFPSEASRKMVNLQLAQNFCFKGSKILLVHVLFNLIKNALHFIAKAGKGEVYLITTKSKRYHVLHFKDTAAGIPAADIPHLFTRFFSTTNMGNGIGLSYCKMVMERMGGDIQCKSAEGKFTEFLLRFPIVNIETT